MFEMKTMILSAEIAAAVFCTLMLLYFWMIMPRLIFKPDERPFKRWNYAHRGLHDNDSDAPENSLAAFRKAVEAGYGMELDIRLSKDRIPVVFHDITLDRMCGVHGRVQDYTYEELQQFTLGKSRERIPKFEDVLKLVDGKTPLIVEFKVDVMDLSICPIACRLLDQYKGLYCMESFHPLCILWFRIHRNHIVRGQLSDGFWQQNHKGPHFFLVQNLLFNFIGRPDFVAYNHKYATGISRRLCHRFYRSTAVAWTIKSQKELDRAKKDFDLFIFDSFVPRES